MTECSFFWKPTLLPPLCSQNQSQRCKTYFWTTQRNGDKVSGTKSPGLCQSPVESDEMDFWFIFFSSISSSFGRIPLVVIWSIQWRGQSSTQNLISWLRWKKSCEILKEGRERMLFWFLARVMVPFMKWAHHSQQSSSAVSACFDLIPAEAWYQIMLNTWNILCSQQQLVESGSFLWAYKKP